MPVPLQFSTAAHLAQRQKWMNGWGNAARILLTIGCLVYSSISLIHLQSFQYLTVNETIRLDTFWMVAIFDEKPLIKYWNIMLMVAQVPVAAVAHKKFIAKSSLASIFGYLDGCCSYSKRSHYIWSDEN